MTSKNLASLQPNAIGDLACVALAGILIRIALSFLFDFDDSFYTGDSVYYLSVGQSIVETGIHGDQFGVTSSRAPLYSLFAGVVGSVSKSAVSFYVVQSAFFVGAALAVYGLLRPNGRRTAFLAALLIAASPFDALYNGRVLSENLVTPLLLLGTVAFAYARTAMGYVLSGVLLGLTALSKEIYVLLPVCFLGVGVWGRVAKRDLALFALAFLIITAPWAYRNSQLPAGGFYVAAGGFWGNLWIGTWERNPDWLRTPDDLPPEAFRAYEDRASPEAIMQAWEARTRSPPLFRELTLGQIRERPLNVIWSWVARYQYLWVGTRSESFSTHADRGSHLWFVVKSSLFLINMAILTLSMVGMVIALKTGKLSVVLLCPVVYTATIYVPFHNTETRYSQPVMPILAIYVSVVVGIVFQKLRR